MRTKYNIQGVFSKLYRGVTDMLSHKSVILSFFVTFTFTSGFCNEPEIVPAITPVSCYGADDGKLVLLLKNAPSECTVRLALSISGDTLYRPAGNDSEIEFNHLAGGSIDISLFSNTIKISETTVYITEPEPLLAGKINIDRAPADESVCDGALSVNPKGGNPPYLYKWSENAGASDKSTVSNVCMGIYRCEINDSNNCGPVYISIPLLRNIIDKE